MGSIDFICIGTRNYHNIQNALKTITIFSSLSCFLEQHYHHLSQKDMEPESNTMYW